MASGGGAPSSQGQRAGGMPALPGQREGGTPSILQGGGVPGLNQRSWRGGILLGNSGNLAMLRFGRLNVNAMAIR